MIQIVILPRNVHMYLEMSGNIESRLQGIQTGRVVGQMKAQIGAYNSLWCRRICLSGSVPPEQN